MSAYTCDPCTTSVLPEIPTPDCIKPSDQLVAIGFALTADATLFDSGVNAIGTLSSWTAFKTAGTIVFGAYVDSTVKNASETNVQGADANDSVGGYGYAVSKNNPTITGNFPEATQAQKDALFDVACNSQTVGLTFKQKVFLFYASNKVEAVVVSATTEEGVPIVRFDFEDPANGDTRNEIDKSPFTITLPAGYSRDTEKFQLDFDVSELIAA